MLYSLSGLLSIPLGLHPCDLFMEISFQFKVLPAQDKRLPIFRIITRHKVVKPQINRQFMSVLWKFFLVRDLINNNNFTVSLLRRIDPQLFDLIHAPENLIFKVKKVFMDLICFFHIFF